MQESSDHDKSGSLLATAVSLFVGGTVALIFFSLNPFAVRFGENCFVLGLLVEAVVLGGLTECRRRDPRHATAFSLMVAGAIAVWIVAFHGWITMFLFGFVMRAARWF